jgi:hypothetical protein
MLLKDQICAYVDGLIQAKLISEDAEGHLISLLQTAKIITNWWYWLRQSCRVLSVTT